MSFGAAAKTVPPNPNDPKLPFPNENRDPSSVKIILCYFPLLISLILLPSRAITI